MATVTELSSVEPKQARSRARRAALIEYGIELLGRCELDEFSITEITGALGYSTGSFYSYFADKEAYFIAIQEWVNDELVEEFEKTFAIGHLTSKTLTGRMRISVRFALNYFRRRTGVIRSALRYERRIPAGWAPNRERTRKIVEAVTENLEAGEKKRLETALQMAFGLMVNAMLHDPGPLRLDDPGLEDAIIGALAPFLELEI